jgi:hypothetical protein
MKATLRREVAESVRPQPSRLHPSSTMRGALRARPDTREERREETAPELLARVRREYAELPGLSLTDRQVERLFGVRRDECLRVLKQLVREGMLQKTSLGRYVTTRSA